MVEERMSVFEGRMQLDDGAAEIEVTVVLTGDQVTLTHATGELGHWARSSVTVETSGGGWFSIVLPDEQVAFAPRRPGPFAGAVGDLAPVVDAPERRWRRTKQAAPPKPEPPDRKHREEPEEPAQPAEPTEPEFSTPVEGDPFGLPPAISSEPVAGRRSNVGGEAVGPPHSESAVGQPSRLKAKKQPKAKQPQAEKQPRVAKKPKAATKQPKIPRQASPKQPEVARPPREPRLRPAAAAAGRGISHFALVISDRLRQTGIVPFDRLPGLDGRRTRDPDHRHEFHEHRLPGGLTRNVCHGCGHVSIGDSEK